MFKNQTVEKKLVDEECEVCHDTFSLEVVHQIHGVKTSP